MSKYICGLGFLRWVVSVLIFISFSGCIPVPAGLLIPPKFDPVLQWHVIQTDHFTIYYYQGEEAAAQKAARIAEEVHATLAPRIGWVPKEPTHLVLTDRWDSPGGNATPFPNNTIYIALTSPQSSYWPATERFDNWLRSLITHEYTHILQTDMNHGLPETLRKLFGRYPLPFGIFNSPIPNDLQPHWLIEGLATREETISGGDDRANGAYADMLLRMAIIENRFPTIDQAGGQLIRYPGSNVQYIFGARFLDYIHERFGDAAIKNLNLNYSDNTFPLLVDTNAKETLGVSYVTLWDQWKQSLTEQYHAQQGTLEKSGLTATFPLTKKGDYNLGAQIGLNGDIIYTSLNPVEFPAIRLLDADGKDEVLIRRNSGLTASWSPDFSQLALAQVEFFLNYSAYSDLYLYNIKSKQMKRLTTGARLLDPDFHPNGKDLVAVKAERGLNQLVIYHLDSNVFDPLTWIDNDLLMSHPRWSPDGTRIVLSGWKEGNQDLYLIDIEAKQVKPIRRDRALDLTPTWSPDGRSILFSSDRTGIFNLFAYEIETDALYQITNLLGGALFPDVGLNKGKETIVFSHYSSRGFDLHTISWDPNAWKKVAEGSIKPDITPETTSETDDRGAPLLKAELKGKLLGEVKQSEQENASLPAKPYSAWPTLQPRYWVPTAFAFSSLHGSTLGIATSGHDVLGKHGYSLELLKDNDNLSVSLDYFNDVFYPRIFVGLLNQTSTTYYGYDDLWQSLSMGVTFEKIFFQRYQSVSFGYRMGRLSSYKPTDGTLSESVDLSGYTVSLLYDSRQYTHFSPGSEEGRLFSVGYERFDSRLGSDRNRSLTLLELARYDRLFKPNHVLAMEFSGGVIQGDPIFGESCGAIRCVLRGYPNDFLKGDRAAVGTIAYRFPIRKIERGFGTGPFFFSILHGDVFLDVGNAWDQTTRISDFRSGVGSELKLSATVGYWLPVQLVVGFARGLDPGGEDKTYFEIQGGF